MAKAQPQTRTSPCLPVPEPALEHHLATLARSMEQWRLRKKAPPVLLLTGASGVGKRSMAYHLAQWLLCARVGFAGESEPENLGFEGLLGSASPSEFSPLPCGECASCQKALHDNWVDFKEISTANESGEGGALKIEQFKALRESQGFGAFDGAFRIFLIRDADRMTPQAANSLLKLLEEPPPGWVLILTAADPSLMLSTIVSRTQVIRLKPFSADKLAELLEREGMETKRAREAAAIAGGSWGKALQLMDEQAVKRREGVLAFVAEPTSRLSETVDWAAADSAGLELLLTELERATAALVGWSTGLNKEIPHPTLQRHAVSVTKKLGPARARQFWIERMERVALARRESQAPINRKLLVQAVLAPWIKAE